MGSFHKFDISVLPSDQADMTERCGTCKKKLGVMKYTCKCDGHFCISHLPPQEHQCTYDFRKEAQKVIQKQMDSEPRASSFERI